MKFKVEGRHTRPESAQEQCFWAINIYDANGEFVRVFALTNKAVDADEIAKLFNMAMTGTDDGETDNGPA